MCFQTEFSNVLNQQGSINQPSSWTWFSIEKRKIRVIIDENE